jgi:Regulator of G protein signaling domain
MRASDSLFIFSSSALRSLLTHVHTLHAQACSLSLSLSLSLCLSLSLPLPPSISINRFFQLGSEWEINVEHHQKRSLLENMTAPTPDAFDDIQISIFLLMRLDSFPKFINGKQFAGYLERRLGKRVNDAGFLVPVAELENDLCNERDLGSVSPKKKKKSSIFACGKAED